MGTGVFMTVLGEMAHRLSAVGRGEENDASATLCRAGSRRCLELQQRPHSRMATPGSPPERRSAVAI